MPFSFEAILKSHVHKRLRRLYNYRVPSHVECNHALSHNLGELLAIYENNHETLFIHMQGIQFSVNYPTIYYQDMTNVETLSNQKKLEIDTVVITLHSGKTVHLKIDGRRGRFTDVSGMLMFLRKIPYLVQKYDFIEGENNKT